MSKHLKRKSLTWSTRALIVMMVSVIVYGFAEQWSMAHTGQYFPAEYTYLFAAVFVSEIGGMAWIKVNKEQPRENKYLENIGIYGGTELAQVAQAEQTSDPDSTQPLNIEEGQANG